MRKLTRLERTIVDFGDFILFGICCIMLSGGAIYVLLLHIKRLPNRNSATRGLIAFAVFTIVFLRYLYQIYWLNEGLWGAAFSGDAVQVKLLLSKSASTDYEWEDGATALDVAKSHGNEEIVKILEKAGAKD